MQARLDETIQAMLPELVALRHELHAHPEIRWEEKWTSDRIARFLDEAGVAYKRGYAKGNGIVATIEGTGPKTVALRADMDALEIDEETGVPYASKIPHRMHACGHDGHTTTLCGVAKTLQQNRGQIPGTVRLIFQPAEEQAAGGKYMVQDGALDGVDAVFALHAWPDIPVGSIGLRAGWMMASAGIFEIAVEGKGCHGADPGAGVDPIVVAAHITLALQTIVSREIDPWESGVVTIAQIAAGSTTNIIPPRATLRGTFRSLKPDMIDCIAESIVRIAEATAQAFRAKATVTFGDETYPPLYNHESTTAFAFETAAELLGNDKIIALDHPVMTAEDFSFYLNTVPGTFICLGNSPDPSVPQPTLHNPKFNFNDDALPTGVKLMAGLALRYLER